MDSEEIVKDNKALREKVKDTAVLLQEIKEFLELDTWDADYVEATKIQLKIKIDAWNGKQ